MPLQTIHDEIHRLAGLKWAEMDRTISLAAQGRIGQSIQTVRSGEGKRYMDDLRVAIEAFDVLKSGKIADLQKRSERFALLTVAMNAIAGAENGTARNSLMALHQVEVTCGNGFLNAAREGSVASCSATERDPRWWATNDLLEIGVGAVFPVASDQRDLRTLGNQRGERTLDEAFGAAERVVALANDGQFQMLVLKLTVGGCGVCLSGTRQYPPRTRNYSGRSGGAMAFGRPQC